MEVLSVSVTLTKFQSKQLRTQIQELPTKEIILIFLLLLLALLPFHPFIHSFHLKEPSLDGAQLLMDKPSHGVNSKAQVIDYYVNTLQTVLSSDKDAQMCLYDASWDAHFGFCCDIDEEISSQLASLPGVLSVRPDPDFNSLKKDYSLSSGQPSNLQSRTNMLFPAGNSKHWLVRMDKPGVGVGVVTKAQIVDYYAQILTKVMENEKDAHMCIYHVSWRTNFGFCCELDEDCAHGLAGVPGVLSVQPDDNFESENKDYEGLSFYTSEKTLRAAFEGFGELVEVKVIMDKISKRSKGYAFIEYTTEKAASAALKEMNGKIINGWLIVVTLPRLTHQDTTRVVPDHQFDKRKKVCKIWELNAMHISFNKAWLGCYGVACVTFINKLLLYYFMIYILLLCLHLIRHILNKQASI